MRIQQALFLGFTLASFAACKSTPSDSSGQIKGISAETNELGFNSMKYLEFVDVYDPQTKKDGVCAYAFEDSYWFGSDGPQELEELQTDLSNPTLSKKKRGNLHLQLMDLYAKKLIYFSSDKVKSLYKSPVALDADSIYGWIERAGNTGGVLNGSGRRVRENTRKTILSMWEGAGAAIAVGGTATVIAANSAFVIIALASVPVLIGVSVIGAVGGMAYVAIGGDSRPQAVKQEITALKNKFSSKEIAEFRFDNILNNVKFHDAVLKTATCPDLGNLGREIQKAVNKKLRS